MSNLMTTLDTVIRESLTEETLNKYIAQVAANTAKAQVKAFYTTFPIKNLHKYGPPPIPRSRPKRKPHSDWREYTDD